MVLGASPILSGPGPAPLVEAPKTPFSDRPHSVMSQFLADITSPGPELGHVQTQAASCLSTGRSRWWVRTQKHAPRSGPNRASLGTRMPPELADV